MQALKTSSNTSTASTDSLDLLSQERQISIPNLKRELSNEGIKLLRKAISMETDIPKIRAGDIVMAPYENNMYIAEVLRITDKHHAKIFFIEYNDYATIAINLLQKIDEEEAERKKNQNLDLASGYQVDEDDFSASMNLGGGGGGSGSSMYSSKHIRAQMERATGNSKNKKGPVSRIKSKK